MLLIPALILSIYAQAKVSSTYERYSKISSSSGYMGKELAEEILRRAGISYINIESIPGKLASKRCEAVFMLTLPGTGTGVTTA